jgi:1,4-dihydroxy-2-naphthoyl-CoA hydrolase
MPPPTVALERTLDGTLGFEATEVGEDVACGRFRTTDRVRQPYGLVHGGAFAAFAESLVSMATALAVAKEGMLAVGLSNHTSFLRPVTAGSVHAKARRRHRGRTTWLWEVDFTDDEGRLCAVSRVTMAVRGREG